jgi:hypothetical protein
MPRNFVIATFSDADQLVRALHAVRRANFRIYDVYAPHPIHEVARAMGHRKSRLPWVTLMAGIGGLLGALFLQFYTAVWDWPLNVGGKPDNSTLAFVPITFELTVLAGGLATFGALLLRTRLFPGKRECLISPDITNHKFALVLRKRDHLFDTQLAYAILERSGAESVQERLCEL